MFSLNLFWIFSPICSLAFILTMSGNDVFLTIASNCVLNKSKPDLVNSSCCLVTYNDLNCNSKDLR